MKAKQFILMLLVMLMSVTGAWAETVSYIDVDGTSKSVDATVITNSSSTLNAGWYVVGTDVQTRCLTCNGAVKLILADGAKLTATGGDGTPVDNQLYPGIKVSGTGTSLTIYGQDNQSGILIANGGYNNAGIGGDNITINGGNVTAKGGYSGAGIGGGNYGNGSNITINGGCVTATGGENGAGIGGGKEGNGSNITINGGVVNAKGGGFAAAIGGGCFANGSYISITGGRIIANGHACGIGGGESGYGEHITITGGDIIASTNRGDAIGNGSNGTGSNNIFVDSSLCLHADNNNPPTTVISHTLETDIAERLTGKKYATIRSHNYAESREEGAAYYTCVCGYIDPVRQHVHSYEWVMDEHQHKQVCTSEVGTCIAREINEAEHTYDNTATAGTEPFYTCSVCGHIDPVRQHVHSYSEDWSSDGTHHWHECTSEVGTCTAKIIDEAIHTYGSSLTDDAINYTCETCGYVDEEKKAPYDARDYMSFTAVGGDVTIGTKQEDNPTYVMQYSQDRIHWTEYAVNNDGTIATIPEGQTYYFRTASPTVQTSVMDYEFIKKDNMYDVTKVWWFTMSGTGTIEAGGNTMSLLDQSCQSKTVGMFCFWGLFYKCESLTVAPELPATTLDESCYSLMFANCINLRKAPYLPATALPYECYSDMFGGCTSLNYVEADFTETLTHVDLRSNTRPYQTTFEENTARWLADTAEKGNLVLKRSMIRSWGGDVDLPDGWKKALKIKANEDPDHKGKFYTTYYASGEYEITDGFKAYTGSIVSGEENDELLLTPIEYDCIPYNTAVVICSDTPDVVLPWNQRATIDHPLQGNALIGSPIDTTAPANCYILSYGQHGLGFYKYAEGNALSAYKAYLIYERPAGAPAKALRMVFAEDETGISNVNDNDNDALRYDNDNIYSINGIRLNRLQKSLNIVNGKKVISK